MVPSERIIAEAIKHKVNAIGLSGLITPSLDEMVTVAKEMEKAGLSIPLLIGGATTSRIHTAVKIDEHYKRGQAVHVLDASRAVTVAGKLLGEEKDTYIKDIQDEYARMREHHSKKRADKDVLSYADAVKNKFPVNWDNYKATTPKFLGVKVFEDLDLAEIVPYIDWTPFFQTWELHGKYPAILTDEVVGEEATKLFADAKEMLEKIVSEKWLQAKAVIGLWKANAVDDEIELYNENNEVIGSFQMLRQQQKKAEGTYNMSLADFIAPKDLGIKDYMGGFAVTAGLGIEPYIEKFEKDHDDYNSILLKALADRFAEATTEYMHYKVRTDFWGYVSDENLSNEDLIKEKYKGIRPAPGYPACPDHTEKPELFRLLNATETIGISLTDSLAMYPASSVSGWYFGNPQSKYFGVGRIEKDQVESYAKRKKQSLAFIEKWLSPNLNY
jgi:5-methyltetrahydrofolate--homocysteine methyltransferase